MEKISKRLFTLCFNTNNLLLFLIYLGLKDGYDFQSSYDINGNTKITDCENYFYNFNLILGFGSSALIFSILKIFIFARQKSRFNKQKQSKLTRTENITERIIDNNFYEFRSSISTRKHHWKAFESYNELENYILINTYKKSNFHIEFINLEKFSPEQKNELIKILAQNNIEKE